MEIIRAAGNRGTSMICDHAAAIICDGRVLSDTEQFHCLPLQGYDGCMEKGNRSAKLIKQVMKVLERI